MDNAIINGGIIRTKDSKVSILRGLSTKIGLANPDNPYTKLIKLIMGCVNHKSSMINTTYFER